MKHLILVISILFSINAYAVPGGEGNNTGCNGVGNPNSPCEGNDNGGGNNGGGDGGTGGNGGEGGSGGGGGNAIVAVDVDGFNMRPHSDSEAKADANAQAAANSSLDAEQKVIITQNRYGSDLSKRVPDAYAPSTNNSTNPYSCLRGASAAGSGSGVAVSFGGYMMDKNCDARVTSDQLMEYGLPDLALEVICSIDSVREADKRVVAKHNVGARCYHTEVKAQKPTASDYDIWGE